MIHVAHRLWGGDGHFAKMTGVSMLSMFENTKEEVTVHIMHNDRLTPDNRGKFCYIAGKYNQRVEFHNVEQIAGASLRKFEAVYPNESGINAAWYPLIVHEVFPHLNKLIFFGADTLINLDIAELWSYDPNQNECGFAAVPDHLIVPRKILEDTLGIPPLIRDNHVKYEDYLCADVFLINPEFFRENFDTILNACKFMHENNYGSAEQDVLNYLYSTKYKKLPSKFNMAAFWTRQRARLTGSFRIEKMIYHFGGPKPDLNVDDPLNRLWFEYFLNTPWANIDMIGNLNKSLKKNFVKFLNESHDHLLHFTKLLTKRRRAFIVDENFREAAKQIFETTPDEIIVSLAEGAETLVKKMNDSKGEVIFFVLPSSYSQYQQIKNFLLNQKFIEGIDFVNGLLFLSERHGLNFYFEARAFIEEINKDM